MYLLRQNPQKNQLYVGADSSSTLVEIGQLLGREHQVIVYETESSNPTHKRHAELLRSQGRKEPKHSKPLTGAQGRRAKSKNIPSMS